MANSKFEYVRQYEDATETRLPRDSYVIIRIDGQDFHRFTQDHIFDKPNDKRALDLMIISAKHVMKKFNNHIPISYGHSDEFSFLIHSKSLLFARRTNKLTSLVVSAFTSYYVYKWNEIFQNAHESSTKCGDKNPYRVTPLKYAPSFDSRAIIYTRRQVVKDYFCWRYVDCHVNNLYNTALHAMSGLYVRHEFEKFNPDIVPNRSGTDCGSGDPQNYLRRTSIQEWIDDKSKFMSQKSATIELTGSVKKDKHDIMFQKYGINYNNEIDQFKKGTFCINMNTSDTDKKSLTDSDIIHFSGDPTKEEFWKKYSHIFDDDEIPE